MIRSLQIPSSSSSSLLFESVDRPRPRCRSTVCSARRSEPYIPKLEPFSRSKIDRGVKDPSFLQKSENDLADYCCTLEGDQSYSCWRAYFELKDLEKEIPKREVENLIRQTDGVKSLVGCLHGVTAGRKVANKDLQTTKISKEKQQRRPFPVPDGLPKTQEELEDDEKGRMPDSPFTRLLRSKGKFPAWYSPTPDHETD